METCEVKRKWALHFKDGPLKKVFTAQVMIPMQEGNNNRIKKNAFGSLHFGKWVHDGTGK